MRRHIRTPYLAILLMLLGLATPGRADTSKFDSGNRGTSALGQLEDIAVSAEIPAPLPLDDHHVLCFESVDQTRSDSTLFVLVGQLHAIRPAWSSVDDGGQ